MFFDDSTAVNDLTPRFAALSGQYPECVPIILPPQNNKLTIQFRV